MRVSSEYLKNCVLLSLTSMAGQISRVLLAYVIPCINKASLVLYIAGIHNICADTYACYVPICTMLSSSSL